MYQSSILGNNTELDTIPLRDDDSKTERQEIIYDAGDAGGTFTDKDGNHTPGNSVWPDTIDPEDKELLESGVSAPFDDSEGAESNTFVDTQTTDMPKIPRGFINVTNYVATPRLLHQQ
ncbi:hypothetical protein M231_03694 [Tremella mesenterica]|uniref:Uncharacterized protein n=1 Tax=Tremella mesenterica TaxID=5217 RepID=A0A4Q1BMC2_TREME|nr:hypothetical protein M231_03694 [Tremella mesenterica]